MSKAILPPVYLGNVLYYAIWLQHDNIAWAEDHRYPKQTYRNRCDILGANGMIKCSIPVQKPHGSKSMLSEITISNAENWPKDHWKSIESAYRSTPFFEHYAPKLYPLLQPQQPLLSEHCKALHFALCDMMHIKGPEKMTTDLKAATDYSFYCSPKNKINMSFPPYEQAFFDKLPFAPNCSIIDALMNLGPETVDYLKEIRIDI